jgi:hypothetical protein
VTVGIIETKKIVWKTIGIIETKIVRAEKMPKFEGQSHNQIVWEFDIIGEYIEESFIMIECILE